MNIIALVLVILAPASGFAIDVPLRAGQSSAQVFEALKAALGTKHRFFGDDNVMQVWNVPTDVAFVLPENARPSQLKDLEKIVEDLFEGQAVDEPRAEGEVPRSVRFGQVPMRFVQPTVTASEGDIDSDPIYEEDAFGSGYVRLTPRRLTLQDIATLIAMKHQVDVSTPRPTLEQYAEAELIALNRAVDPADVKNIVDLVQIDAALRLTPVTSANQRQMIRTYVQNLGRLKRLTSPGGAAVSLSTGGGIGATPRLIPITDSSDNGAVDATAPGTSATRRPVIQPDGASRVGKTAVASDLAKRFSGGAGKDATPDAREHVEAMFDEIEAQAATGAVPSALIAPRAPVVAPTGVNAPAQSISNSCGSFATFGFARCRDHDIPSLGPAARQVLIDAATVTTSPGSRVRPAIPAPHDETEDFGPAARRALVLMNQVVVECEPRWTVAYCVDHTVRRMTETDVLSANTHQTLYLDDTAVAAFEREAFQRQFIAKLTEVSAERGSSPKRVLVRSEGKKLYDEIVYGKGCSRYLEM